MQCYVSFFCTGNWKLHIDIHPLSVFTPPFPTLGFLLFWGRKKRSDYIAFGNTCPYAFACLIPSLCWVLTPMPALQKGLPRDPMWTTAALSPVTPASAPFLFLGLSPSNIKVYIYSLSICLFSVSAKSISPEGKTSFLSFITVWPRTVNRWMVEGMKKQPSSQGNLRMLLWSYTSATEVFCFVFQRKKCQSISRSVVSNSLRSHGL